MTLNKRKFILAAALLITLISAFFAPAKQNDEVVEAKKVVAESVSALSDKVHFPLEQNPFKLVEKRVWVIDKDHDLFPAKIKPLPPIALSPAIPILPPKPTAPALPFTYIGKVIEEGKPTVFVAKQMHHYLLKGGEVIEATYRVDKVEISRVVFTYLPLETEQVMIFGGKD